MHEGTKMHEDNFAPRIIFALEYKNRKKYIRKKKLKDKILKKTTDRG